VSYLSSGEGGTSKSVVGKMGAEWAQSRCEGALRSAATHLFVYIIAQGYIGMQLHGILHFIRNTSYRGNSQ
jgi:hypothetical protein